MTRAHFALIAAVIRDALRDPLVAGCETSGINLVARQLAAALATTNPRFNRAKFLAGCGVDP